MQSIQMVAPMPKQWVFILEVTINPPKFEPAHIMQDFAIVCPEKPPIEYQLLAEKFATRLSLREDHYGSDFNSFKWLMVGDVHAHAHTQCTHICAPASPLPLHHLHG